MSRVSTIFTNFIVGEVSPRQEGRVDLQSYYQSCRTLQNFVISSHGGIERTPGTKFICKGDKWYVDNVDKPSRLIPFKKGNDQYVLEFGHAVMYVIKGLTQLSVEKSTPYADNQVMNIHYTKVSEGDMYCVEVNDRPQRVTCSTSTSWTVANITFTGITFSAANSYPGAICIFEQRLVMAGSNSNPNRVWFSKPGNFTNFASASGAFVLDVYTTDRMQIKWLVAAKDAIVFGSDSAVGIITGNGAALTASNYQIRMETAIGTAIMQALLVGDTVIYPQIGARTMREFAYNNDGQAWYTKDLTMLADHLAPPTGFKDMALQVNPDVILWMAAGANGLCGLTYDKMAGIQGWHPHTLGGTVESVCITRPHSSINEDIIYLTVYRSTGPTLYKRTIEYMTVRDFGSDQVDAYFVQNGKTTDLLNKNIDMTGATQSSTGCVVTVAAIGTLVNGDYVRITGVVGMTELNDNVYFINNISGNTFKLYALNGSTVINSSGFGAYVSGGHVTKVLKYFTGYTHLKGKTISVLADGAAHPDVTVTSGGAFTLQVYANKVHGGYGYSSILKPQRIEAGADDGTAQGAVKRIHEIVVRVVNSLGCKIGPDTDDLDPIIFRTSSDLMGSPPPLYSGDKRITFPGGYETDGDIVIVQDQPLPLIITALVAKLATYE